METGRNVPLMKIGNNVPLIELVEMSHLWKLVTCPTYEMFWNVKRLLKTYEWIETYKTLWMIWKWNLWKLMNDLKLIKTYEWLETIKAYEWLEPIKT